MVVWHVLIHLLNTDEYNIFSPLKGFCRICLGFKTRFVVFFVSNSKQRKRDIIKHEKLKAKCFIGNMCKARTILEVSKSGRLTI